MKLALCVGASALAFARAASAQAQDTLPDPHTEIRVSLTNAYEDNALKLSDAEPTPAGFSRNDYRLTPSLDVDVVRPIGVQSVFAKGSAGYDFYKRNKRLERERINLTGGTDLRLGGGCWSHAEANFARQQSDLRDFTRAVGLRNAERRQRYSISAGCGRMFGLKPSFSFDRDIVQNSALIRRDSNFSANTYGTSLGFVSPALGEISVFASYRDGKYPNRFRLLPTPEPDGIEVYNAGLRFSRSIGTRLRGNVSLGYNRVEPKLSGVPGFTGASYSAGITFIPNDRLQMQLDVGRSVSQSNLLNVSYSIDDSYALGATYAINREFKARLGGSLLKRRFQDSPTLPPNQLGANDRFKQLSGGIEYSPRGRIGFVADVTTARRSSPVNAFDFNYTTARFTVRFAI